MKSQFIAQDTIAALATPPGEGALAIVRLSGAQSLPIAASYLTLAKGESLLSLEAWRAALGAFHQNGCRVDQVIVTVYRAPHSFTGEDMAEISCHGGPAVVKQILDLLFTAGARPAEPGEFSQRAYLNGKIDLVQAQAVSDLISARTSASSRAALANLEGRLSEDLRGLRAKILKMMASLEVAIDHTDDSTVGAAQTLEEIGAGTEGLIRGMDRLISSYDFGRLLKEGLKVAIIGRPNVGKSSLLNCLLKSERAIVSAIPGTTRDTVEEAFDLLGVPATLVDTAGLRSHTLDPVEEIGMARTRKAVSESEAVVVVVDGAQEFSPEEERVAALAKGKPAVVAVGKNDLPRKADGSKLKALYEGFPLISISAAKASGIDELLRALYSQVAPLGGSQASEDSAMLSSLREKNCLQRARGNLSAARELIRKKEPEECVALELREVLDGLGELVGETATEDILNEVFSTFCIGK